VDLRRERDVEQLRRIALAQQVQIEQLLRVLQAKCKELEALKGDPTELQQTLALVETLTKQHQQAAVSVAPDAARGQRKSQKQRAEFGPTPQPDLATEERLFELDEPDRVCPGCGGELRAIDGQCEESEMIDVVEVSYRVVKVKQQKYGCRCGGAIETAPGPERATKGGRYSLEFAIKVALDKYLDHIPLARQERIMQRHGLVVTTQALWDQLDALARRLTSTDEALLKYALLQPVIGLDQTSWKRLDSSGGKPWQMWCITAPRVVCHRIRNDKGANTFRELVGSYHGTVVCDALKTHEAGARDGPGIVLAGCWAHVYRKFEEAAADHPEALLATKWIGELYAIDERAGDDAAERRVLRQRESAAVLNTLKTWLWTHAALKTLSMGRAAAYAIANWERLTRFVDNPLVPLDNNATERAIRGPVVGRKNHYGSKSKRGTEVAAVFYSLLETAKLHSVNPDTYLREAVRAADRGECLLPWQLAAVITLDLIRFPGHLPKAVKSWRSQNGNTEETHRRVQA
jgi:transposase